MICARCGTDNEAGRRFCKECATPLARPCPDCEASNPPDAKFCGDCAASLLTPATEGSAGPPAPVAERRLVTVLFADLVGFTTFAEGRDAEDVREALSTYFELAREVVRRYGGTIEKFIGDAVMAVWGAPTAHEDDAERAVRAAMELVDVVPRVGPGIVARAGVLTGEAAVTLGATDQGMIAGDLVNTAARLQGVAAPGSVLVGDATRRATSNSIDYDEAGAQPLKGKAAPVPAWRAVRVVSEVGGKNRAVALEAPFVGRDDELRLLKELFHATGREGRARVVSIVAPAGFGKSRLTWEFSKYIDGLVEPVWWHAGRSPAYGEGITFWALGEMVRERAGLAETDDEATVRASIRESVDEWIPDATERRWVESALLALLGAEAGVRNSEELFGAWRTFFERIAARGTVVLLFEDLHWADAGTLDFIEHLTEWARNVPLFIVTLARPELADRRPDWGVGGRNFSSIALEPLGDTAMGELLDGLVSGLPVDARRRIVARAEGVPLYAVEIVRSLLADGDLVQSDGAISVRPSADLAKLSIPETLTALIAARLDALKDADRRLVGVAAVLGQSFTPAALAAVAGSSEVEVAPRLRSLVRGEIFGVATDPRSPERGQYAFVQAMIREVAYNTLAKRDRRTRHLAAARYFETLESDELAAAVAGHLLAAHGHSAPGPEADAVAHQARIALRAAAERAAQLGAHDQAVAFVEQALTVATNSADEIELLERGGRSASEAGHYTRAEGFLRRAIERDIVEEQGRGRARLHAGLGSALLSGYRLAAGIELLSEAMSADDGPANDVDHVRLAAQLARGWLMAGDNERAIATAEQALIVAESLDAVDIVTDLLTTKGSAMVDMGRVYEGSGIMRAALDLARMHDLRIAALRAMTNIVVTLIGRDPRDGVRLAREAIEEAKRIGSRQWLISGVGNGIEAALWTGDWPWALREANELLATDLDRSDRASLLAGVAQIGAFQGHEGVGRMLAEITSLIGDLGDASTQGMILGATSHAAFAAGDLERARSEAIRRGHGTPINTVLSYSLAARAAIWLRDGPALREDLDALRKQGRGPAASVHLITFDAAVAGFEGRIGDALALYRRALAEWTDLGLPLYVAMTALDMAAVLGADHPEVREALGAGRSILAGVGATPFLARVDGYLASPARHPTAIAFDPPPSRSIGMQAGGR